MHEYLNSHMDCIRQDNDEDVAEEELYIAPYGSSCGRGGEGGARGSMGEGGGALRGGKRKPPAS